MELYTVEGTNLTNSNELIDYLREQAKVIRAEQQKKYEEKRDWELVQLSKHLRQFREEFNDKDSLKLLEATLETNAQLARQEEYEQM